MAQKYLEVLQLRKENRCLHEISMILYIAIYSLSIYQLLSELLAEVPTILDSVFTGRANTNSTITGWEVGRASSYEVA